MSTTNERWLRWAIAWYYRTHDFKVSMNPVKVGIAMVDGVAKALKESG